MKLKRPASCSLIITTYNWPQALDLSLKSALAQAVPPDEILVADDGSGEETARLVRRYAETSIVPVRHIWQEDCGYRLAASRNRAVAAAKGEYVVVADGDMLLHPCFIRDHLDRAMPGTFIQGSRVLGSQAAAMKRFTTKSVRIFFFEKGLKNRKNTLRIPFLSAFFAHHPVRSLKGIRGCNFSFFRTDCIRVNGFNEDFTGWGREDSEFAVRMINSGVFRRNVRFSAIAYHLWHKENARQSLPANDRLLEAAIAGNLTTCSNGIGKYLNHSGL